jgi:hypothetical protein
MSTAASTDTRIVVEFWKEPQGKNIEAVPFDLTDWMNPKDGHSGVPRQLLLDLAEGLTHALGPSGTWNEIASADTGVQRLERFARMIARDSDSDRSERKAVSRLSDFTGSHWNDLAMELPQPGEDDWAGTRQFLLMVRVVLRACPTLPATARERMEWQLGTRPETELETYTVEEQKLFLDNAWEHLVKRRDEIVANYQVWCTSRDDLPPEQQDKWDAYNDYMTGFNRPQAPARCRALDPDRLRKGGKASERYKVMREQLFLSWADVTAIVTLLAGAHGKALQSIVDLEEPSRAASFADPIKFLQTTTHKNRRAFKNRHTDTMAGQFSDYGLLIELIEDVTAPARQLLRSHHNSEDADRLILLWSRQGAHPVPVPSGFTTHHWLTAGQAWLAGTGFTSLSAEKLKRTYTTVWGGIKVDKNAEELEAYWRRLAGHADALDERLVAGLKLFHEVIDTVTFAGTVLTNDNTSDLAEAEHFGVDIPNFTLGCASPTHQPTTFLMCYECPFAVMTEKMIPMNVLILDRLRDLQDSPGHTAPDWDGYGKAMLRVRDALMRLHVTDDELDDYRNEATIEDRLIVDDMFSGLFDEIAKMGGVNV